MTKDTISRQQAIDAVSKLLKGIFVEYKDVAEKTIGKIPSAQQEIIQCKDCKHNPKESWFGCPMSHLSEKQRPETAWCWKGEPKEQSNV